ncbi:TIGR00659 family protein [Clostridium sp. DSM 8431]|uniref:LrgB family protein n=1 Tax=Clostridium sp. DSM 8431 TaxID=1761781 RepID=UPI0008E866DE|nr:LrgB family protein [Clostridium sp. DSM 8431]SFU54167.1 TIGR00659 family protein [Clostridium sp. DSM 8431]
MDILINEMFFGIVLSLVAFEIGLLIYRKTNIPVFNPLLIAISLVTGFLLVFHIDFSVYNVGGQFINMFLGPATVVLAVPLYKQLELLKKHAPAILIGILLGSLIGICSVVLLAYLFGLNAELIRSLLPKSVTTPIGIELSNQLQGIVPITVLAIIISGIAGAVLGPTICKLFRITDSVAIGVAIGTSSHAVGTSKAFEIGETEGAMSSLSVGIAGIMTVFLAPLIYSVAQYVHAFIKVIS